jgi:fluoroquinolone transport system permease protein
MISFSVPTFSPAWIEWIPSYGALFAYEEILFPTGKSILSIYLLLGVETVIAFFVCAALVKRRLLSARGCVS